MEYGPWGRIYDLFRRWQRDGTRHRTRLKRHRAVVTRYDQLAVRYEAAVLIAAINEWL